MGRAFLQLYQATAAAKWLDLSKSCADFCAKKFSRNTEDGGGFLSGCRFSDAPSPVADRDENIEMTRWLNLLARTTGESRFSKNAEHAIRFLATDRNVEGIYSFTGGLLLADAELAEEPTHVAVVGKKDDPAAIGLFQAAQKCPTSYKVIEWLSPGEKSSSDTEFPEIDRAAAYLCTGTRCSLPKFTAEALTASFGKN